MKGTLHPEIDSPLVLKEICNHNESLTRTLKRRILYKKIEYTKNCYAWLWPYVLHRGLKFLEVEYQSLNFKP